MMGSSMIWPTPTESERERILRDSQTICSECGKKEYHTGIVAFMRHCTRCDKVVEHRVRVMPRKDGTVLINEEDICDERTNCR